MAALSAAQTGALTAAVGAAADAADDGTRLRALQAAALLAQAKPVLHTPGAIAALLGAAGRVLARAGGGAPRPGAPPPPPLASTAAATARQIVAVAFEAAAHAPATSPAREGALALLYDLCGVASASGAPPPWAAGGAPPGRAHALALLDVALATGGAPLFAGDPTFADALRTGVRLALLTALQASLSDATPQRALPPAAGRADRAAAAVAAATAASDAAAALRAARTALGAHHGALGGRAAPLVGVLVAGAARACPPHQRAAVMRVLRDVCGDADLLLFLHSEFDAKVGPPSAATAATARASVDGAPTPAAPRAALAVLTAASDDTLAALATGGCGVGDLRSLGGAGRETVDWPPPDAGDSRAERAAAASAARDAARKAAALAVDGLLQFAAAAVRLADKGGDDATASARSAAAAALVSDAWRPVADGLVALASSPSSDDDAVARGLKGVLALSRAAAGLGLPSPRDALLARLAALALPLDAVGGGGGGEQAASASSRPPSAPLERARSGGLSLDAAPSTSAALALAPPHVHALRALFNAAATLGPGLDAGGWAPLLRVVARLDAALADPATIVLEPGGATTSTDSGARDLDVLRGAADALFAGSGGAGDAGVAALTTALADVAADEAAAAATAPAAPPPRALARVADVVLANPGRLAALWPRLEAGVSVALASPAPSARTAGVDALRRGVDGVLARAREAADAGDGDAAAEADAAALGGVSRAADAAAAASDGDEAAVMSVLEASMARHGDRLTAAGWVPALALLARVPSDRGVGPAAVRAGWAAVQAAADAFPGLPAPLLPSALDAVAAYIHQGADVNVALSAVGGLWSAADATRAPSPPPADGGPALRHVLASLADAAADARAEVRDAAVRTLASVLDGAAPSLSPAGWDAALSTALLPVARAAARRAAAATKAATAPPPAAGDAPGGPSLVLHHSRDTERKRWDETLALTLAAIGRLLRSHGAAGLGGAPSLAAGWDEVMAMAEAALAGGGRDVAAAALAAAAAGLDGGAALPRTLRDRSLRALCVAVEAAASPDACRVPQAARLELASTLTSLLSPSAPGRAALTQSDGGALLAGLARLAAAPRAADDPPLPAGAVPAVSRAVLAALPSLAPPPHPSLWPDLLAVAGAAAAAGGGRPASPGAAATAAAGAVALASLFCGPAPWRARARPPSAPPPTR